MGSAFSIKPKHHIKRPNISILKLAIHSALTSAMFLSGSTAFAETNNVELPQVDVTAPRVSDNKPVKGYNAKHSTSATKTDAELRDVPQSISVVTQDQIKDQSVQSVSDAIRYVPGVTAIQGEGVAYVSL